MGIDLVVVAEEHKHVLANLLQFYRYDFSVIRGYELTPHGTFIYCYLDSYFTEDGREACFITADGQLAGFTMTRRMEDGAREVAEFFVARRYRRHGVAGLPPGRCSSGTRVSGCSPSITITPRPPGSGLS